MDIRLRLRGAPWPPPPARRLVYRRPPSGSPRRCAPPRTAPAEQRGGVPFTHARTHARSVPLPHPCKTCEAIIRAACRERCAESTEWVHQWREHAAPAKLAVRTLARTSSTVDALSCFGEASAFVLRAPPGVWMTILTKAPIVPMRYNVRGSALDRWPHLSGADRSAGFVLAAAFPLRAIHLTVTCM